MTFATGLLTRNKLFKALENASHASDLVLGEGCRVALVAYVQRQGFVLGRDGDIIPIGVYLGSLHRHTDRSENQ